MRDPPRERSYAVVVTGLHAVLVNPNSAPVEGFLITQFFLLAILSMRMGVDVQVIAQIPL